MGFRDERPHVLDAALDQVEVVTDTWADLWSFEIPAGTVRSGTALRLTAIGRMLLSTPVTDLALFVGETGSVYMAEDIPSGTSRLWQLYVLLTFDVDNDQLWIDSHLSIHTSNLGTASTAMQSIAIGYDAGDPTALALRAILATPSENGFFLRRLLLERVA